MNPETVFHEDGTVTYWDVFRQQWARRVWPERITSQIMATLPGGERDRIEKLADGPAAQARKDEDGYS